MLRPRVVGEWAGRAEEDADPLAAEMLHPPVPQAKIEVCWSGVSSPARRLVWSLTHRFRGRTLPFKSFGGALTHFCIELLDKQLREIIYWTHTLVKQDHYFIKTG